MATKLVIRERNKSVKEILRDLLEEFPGITLDRDTLGEPRVQGHRLSTTNIIYALTGTNVRFARAIMKEWDWDVTDDDVRQSLKFAAEFIHRVMCSERLFSDEDLQEFPRDYTKDP